MILLVGFSLEEIEKIRKVIDEKIRPVGKGEKDEIVENIINREGNLPYNRLGKERIVIMHNVDKERIRNLIWEIRKIISTHIIFATTTSTSLKWKIANLISELKEEDTYFMQRSKEN